MKFPAIFVISLWIFCEGYGQTTNQQPRASFDTTLPIADVQAIEWSDLPPAVQRAFKAQGGDLAGMRSGTLRGQTVYFSSFPANGSIVRLVVRPDGSIVAGENSPARNEMQRSAQSARQTNSVSATASGEQSDEPVVADTTPPAIDQQYETGAAVAEVSPGVTSGVQSGLTFEQLPPAVRWGLSTQTDSGEIENISRATADGQTVYDITYRDGAATSRVRLTETGAIVGRAIITESAGAPLAPQPVRMDQLPLRAQNAVSAVTAAAPIIGLERQIVDGQVFFRVTVLQNEQPVQFWVTPEGQVLR